MPRSPAVHPQSSSEQSCARVSIVADDLTGACDAAAPFAEAGLSVTVALTAGGEDPSTDVIALSTETRSLPESAALDRLRGTLRGLAESPHRILLKKLDSLCRGNTFAEIGATASAFPLDLKVFAPAFPAMGRRVTAGRLLLADDPGFCVDLHQALRREQLEFAQIPAESRVDGLAGRVHAAVARGFRILVCDAIWQDDLVALVAAVRKQRLSAVWIGSGGLAHALASSGTRPRSIEAHRVEALLCCVGSRHPVSLRQLDFAVQHGGFRQIADEPAALAFDKERSASRALIRIIAPGMSSAEIREILTLARATAEFALLLSGGDTARLVCTSIEAQSIAIAGELLPGIPWGVLHGGVCDGQLIITKSGAFGADDTLIRVAQACRSGIFGPKFSGPPE